MHCIAMLHNNFGLDSPMDPRSTPLSYIFNPLFRDTPHDSIFLKYKYKYRYKYKYKYTNTACDAVQESTDVCYIFEELVVQQCQKLYYQVFNLQIQQYKHKYKYKYKYKYTNTAFDEVPKRPNICYIFE